MIKTTLLRVGLRAITAAAAFALAATVFGTVSDGAIAAIIAATLSGFVVWDLGRTALTLMWGPPAEGEGAHPVIRTLAVLAQTLGTGGAFDLLLRGAGWDPGAGALSVSVGGVAFAAVGATLGGFVFSCVLLFLVGLAFSIRPISG